MSLDQIKELLQNLENSGETPHFGASHQVITILDTIRMVLQKHEALLLYAHQTLNVDYHRRVDKIFADYKDAVSKVALKGLSHEEKLKEIERASKEVKEARAKLDEEFNIGEKAER